MHRLLSADLYTVWAFNRPNCIGWMLSFLYHLMDFRVASHGSISWSDLSTLPICLLYCSMQFGLSIVWMVLHRTETFCTMNCTEHVYVFLISEFHCQQFVTAYCWRLAVRQLLLDKLLWKLLSIGADCSASRRLVLEQSLEQPYAGIEIVCWESKVHKCHFVNLGKHKKKVCVVAKTS